MSYKLISLREQLEEAKTLHEVELLTFMQSICNGSAEPSEDGDFWETAARKKVNKIRRELTQTLVGSLLDV